MAKTRTKRIRAMVRWLAQKMQDHTQRAKILSLFLLFFTWLDLQDSNSSSDGGRPARFWSWCCESREGERGITVLENAQVCSTKKKKKKKKKKHFGNFLKPNVQETSTFIIQREWCENTPPPPILLSIKKKKMNEAIRARKSGECHVTSKRFKRK